jgi:20S proteasome subunit beta 1
MAAYVQHWIAEHQSEKNGPVDVHTAANLAMQLAYNNKNALQAGLIIAGWDQHKGGSVYAIPLGGTLLKVWGCQQMPVGQQVVGNHMQA